MTLISDNNPFISYTKLVGDIPTEAPEQDSEILSNFLAEKYLRWYNSQPSTFAAHNVPFGPFWALVKEQFEGKISLVQVSYGSGATKPGMLTFKIEDESGSTLLSVTLGYFKEIPDGYEPTVHDRFVLGAIEMAFPPGMCTKLEDLFQQTLTMAMPVFPPSKPVAHIVTSDGNSLTLRAFSLEEPGNPIPLDTLYGEGFDEYHRGLVDKIKGSTKGLALFHGPPGGGKTSYLRMLTRELMDTKTVVFLPKSMFEQLGSPTFTHFLLGLQGREIVLLLEDGEAVLQKRADSKDHRSAVVSLLLNLTDGFLNDLCKVQVVGTFNIDATEIDDALLRNGRLIAMREFGPLSAKEARKLGEHLGKDTKAISGPTMLTDVFHLGNEVTLTQKKKSSPIGFGVRVERVPPG